MRILIGYKPMVYCAGKLIGKTNDSIRFTYKVIL